MAIRQGPHIAALQEHQPAGNFTVAKTTTSKNQVNILREAKPNRAKAQGQTLCVPICSGVQPDISDSNGLISCAGYLEVRGEEMSAVPQKTLNWLHGVLSQVNSYVERYDRETNTNRNIATSIVPTLMSPKRFHSTQTLHFGQMSTV